VHPLNRYFERGARIGQYRSSLWKVPNQISLTSRWLRVVGAGSFCAIKLGKAKTPESLIEEDKARCFGTPNLFSSPLVNLSGEARRDRQNIARRGI
jgi:hypothetical protein